MDRTGAGAKCWFLCMVYVVMILNKSVQPGMDASPEQKCFGVTPDILSLMHFTFNEKVLYADHEESFPESKEKVGRWMGLLKTREMP